MIPATACAAVSALGPALHCTDQHTSRARTASEFGTIVPPVSFENNMAPIAKYTFGEEVGLLTVLQLVGLCYACCKMLTTVPPIR